MATNLLPKAKAAFENSVLAPMTTQKVAEVLMRAGAEVTKVSLWKETGLLKLMEARGYKLVDLPAQMLVVEFPGSVMAFDASADWTFAVSVSLEGDGARASAIIDWSKSPTIFLVSGSDEKKKMRQIVEDSIHSSQKIETKSRKYKVFWAYNPNEPQMYGCGEEVATLVGLPEEWPEGDFVPPLFGNDVEFLGWVE